ncbi:hypothetical protein [Flammeovirga kamogawensis]|uniref:YceI family protein n=1 Tax=Flammeovirga kamogawensis TaxID=373891 RepID=A0ABX8GSU3_9BACT|nr:hypothetical protein [Flammeovirga kamogawensis]MBB6461453.1 hypothetical protein [Flammeovirga kamogawensis]QWG06347.1 hypothetical protein KM029_13530 [Flammeovirga kamogawensis]TRX68175.1 hypothetical protein EO216_08545 [Flammeovirga kamogawensis]
MRALITTTIFFLLSLQLFAQNKSDNIPTKYILEVIPDSSMVIDGKTNINSFNCIYKETIQSELKLTQNIFKESSPVQHTGLDFAVACFDCGIALMNKEFSDLLYEKQYPKISMKLLSMFIYQDSESKVIKGEGKASMIIAGAERIEKITYVVTHKEGKNFQIKGSKVINILDYNITPPKKMMGMVKVDQSIVVNFNFNFIVDDH